MENILQLVEELQANRGKLKKMEILKRESENTEFKSFIKYVLCPMHIYGIQNRKLNRFLGKTDGNTEFNSLFELFEYLLENNTGRDVDAEAVARFIDSEKDEKLKDLYKKAITKNLKMGIDTTVNKAWGKGFIHQFDVMLAKDFYKEHHKIKGKEFVLTEKLDGMRIAFIVKNGEINAFTRQGKPVTQLVELIEEFKTLPNGVYDGELLIKNEDNYTDREVLQETLKLSRKDGVKKGLNFHVFDYLTNEEFEDGESERSYDIRRKIMYNLFDGRVLSHIHLLPILYQGNDLSVVPDMLERLENEGKEGLMLNISDAKYVCKRTNSILKIKTMKSFDEEILDVFEGEGKYENMLGGIVVRYKDNTVRVGSGFSDDERELFWSSPELLVGKYAEVQYFRESKNAEGGVSVSFPVFKGIRHDKTEPSYN